MKYPYVKKEYTDDEKRGMLWTTVGVFIVALAIGCFFEQNIFLLRIVAIIASSGIAGYCFGRGASYFEAKQ